MISIEWLKAHKFNVKRSSSRGYSAYLPIHNSDEGTNAWLTPTKNLFFSKEQALNAIARMMKKGNCNVPVIWRGVTYPEQASEYVIVSNSMPNTDRTEIKKFYYLVTQNIINESGQFEKCQFCGEYHFNRGFDMRVVKARLYYHNGTGIYGLGMMYKNVPVLWKDGKGYLPNEIREKLDYGMMFGDANELNHLPCGERYESKVNIFCCAPYNKLLTRCDNFKKYYIVNTRDMPFMWDARRDEYRHVMFEDIEWSSRRNDFRATSEFVNGQWELHSERVLDEVPYVMPNSALAIKNFKLKYATLSTGSLLPGEDEGVHFVKYDTLEHNEKYKGYEQCPTCGRYFLDTDNRGMCMTCWAEYCHDRTLCVDNGEPAGQEPGSALVVRAFPVLSAMGIRIGWVSAWFSRKYFDEELLNDPFFTDNFTCCSDCGNWYPNDDMEEDEDTGEVLCHHCHEIRNRDDRDDENRYHMGHYHENNTMTYGMRFHTAGRQIDPCLGMELEIDRDHPARFPNRYRHQILEASGTDLDGVKNGERFINHTWDGSLNYGFEMQFAPMSVKEYYKNVNLDGLCEKARELGYSSDRVDTCGLHIHIDRAFFVDKFYRRYNDDVVNGMFIASLLNNIDWIVPFSRRPGNGHYYNYNFSLDYDHKIDCTGSKWKRKSEKGKMSDCMDSAKFTKGEGLRYYAINCTSNTTVEVRLWKGTLIPLDMKATLEITDVWARLIKNLLDNDNVAGAIELTKQDFVKVAIERGYDNMIAYMKKKHLLTTEEVEQLKDTGKVEEMSLPLVEKELAD